MRDRVLLGWIEQAEARQVLTRAWFEQPQQRAWAETVAAAADWLSRLRQRLAVDVTPGEVLLRDVPLGGLPLACPVRPAGPASDRQIAAPRTTDPAEHLTYH